MYCCCSVAQSCHTLCDPMDCGTPGFPDLHLPELAQIHVHWVGDVIQPSCSLSSPSSPAFSLSQHQVFSSESTLHIRWPKIWSFSFSISPSSDYSELISLSIDWFDLLAVQETLKSLLWHHNTKASILPCSTFLMAHLTSICDYWKNHSLIILTFVGNVISLIFNILSRFIIAILVSSKCLLILWLQSLYSDFGVQENKVFLRFWCRHLDKYEIEFFLWR